MPDSIDIDIQSTAVRRLLRDSPAGLGRALRGTFEDSSAIILRDLNTYPPKPANSTYVRTRTLARSWARTSVTGSGLALRVEVGSNSNVAPYNRSVQDADLQTRAHARTGWPTVQGVSAAREATIQDMFEARVRAELGE